MNFLPAFLTKGFCCTVGKEGESKLGASNFFSSFSPHDPFSCAFRAFTQGGNFFVRTSLLWGQKGRPTLFERRGKYCACSIEKAAAEKHCTVFTLVLPKVHSREF